MSLTILKKVIYFIVLVILSIQVLADLSDYPNIFDQNRTVQSVKGHSQSSKHVQASMNIFYTLPGDLNYANRLDNNNEVKDLSTDFILIGGPCQNEITKHFFPDEDCSMGVKEDEVVVRLKENGDQKILLIASPSDDSLVEVTKLIRENPRLFKNKKGDQFILRPKKEESKDAVDNSETNKVKETTEAEFNGKAKQVQKGICDGCETEYGCINLHDSTSVNGKPYYCSDDKQLIEQKALGSSCEFNFECVNNVCNNNVCSKTSWYSRLWSWVRNLF